MIQLTDYSDEPLQSLRFSLINASGSRVDQQGLVNNQDYDPELGEFTRNDFSVIPQETCTEPLVSLMILTWDPDLAGTLHPTEPPRCENL